MATFDEIMEVEGSLQTSDIYYNGISGRKNCHSDSYMTCVDFAALAAWRAKNLFPVDLMNDCIDYWKTNQNMQPPLRLIAAVLSSTPNRQGS